MGAIAVEMQGVSKKFRKGETFDSLRDLIPALAGRAVTAGRSARLGPTEFWALRDVSFQVCRGETFGIIGGNGAGKSTILKILSGVMKPSMGALAVQGRLSALIEVGAGFHPDLTGRENVYLSGTILGMKRQEIQKRFDEIVEFAGLTEFIDTPVKRYSSGMYARLGFSVAAHVNPDILLVDEVLSVGDMVFQSRCLEKMTAVARQGTTVMFVSHNLKSVTDLCDRAILIERGGIVFSGGAQDAVREYIARAYEARGGTDQKDAWIKSFRIRGKDGDAVRFEAGETVQVDIEVESRVPCEKLSVSLYVRDEDLYHLFDTSTERLGLGSFAIHPGEVFRCTFELDLHLANAPFHFVVVLYRYDTEQEYDRREPAGTIYMNSKTDVRGCVNLYPRVTGYSLQTDEPSGRSLNAAGSIPAHQ